MFPMTVIFITHFRWPSTDTLRFRDLDTDGSGGVSLEELSVGFQRIGLKLFEKQVPMDSQNCLIVGNLPTDLLGRVHLAPARSLYPI